MEWCAKHEKVYYKIDENVNIETLYLEELYYKIEDMLLFYL